MLLTLALLGFAHYLAYKKSRKGTGKTNRTLLWISTLAAIGMMAYTLLNRGPVSL